VRRLCDGLQAWFLQFDEVIVAFSGGIDSTLVLAAAVDALGPSKVQAVTACSPSLRSDELELCKELTRSLCVPHQLLETNELENPRYRKNAGDRCYFCKTAMYESIVENILPYISSDSRHALVDGTNLDDIGDLRPGLKAATEAGVKHPLQELALGKSAIRELAKARGLTNWNKPAMACLSSRIPRGTEVTKERLRMIEAAEIGIQKLGIEGARVRFHKLSGDDGSSETLARIEVLPEQLERLIAQNLREEVVSSVKKAGFDFATLDIEGYKVGGRSKK